MSGKELIRWIKSEPLVEFIILNYDFRSICGYPDFEGAPVGARVKCLKHIFGDSEWET
jgi:hypothetical protein